MRVALLILIVGIAVSVSYGQQAEPLLFYEKIHDFGEVIETDKGVAYDFVFINNAGRSVRIIQVQASCGCTTSGWSKEAIANGKTGFIKVIFDPRGKPGYFNKSLTVTTDLGGNAINLQIKGQVVAAVKSAEDVFPAENGSLRMKSNSFNVTRMYINQNPVATEFDIYNAGKITVHFTEKPISPAHIKVETPGLLEPKQRGKIKVTYNAKVKNQYGFVSDNIELITDDLNYERKSFSVYATIEEYFPALSVGELELAPLLQPELSTIDLGRTQKGSSLKGDLKIKNTGKKELIIHTIQPNCACVNIQSDKMKLKAGEETRINISFNGQGRTGTQQKAITIYSNDPQNPVQRITVMAYIEE